LDASAFGFRSSSACLECTGNSFAAGLECATGAGSSHASGMEPAGSATPANRVVAAESESGASCSAGETTAASYAAKATG